MSLSSFSTLSSYTDTESFLSDSDSGRYHRRRQSRSKHRINDRSHSSSRNPDDSNNDQSLMVPYRPKKNDVSRKVRPYTETDTSKFTSTLESGYTSSSEGSSVTESSYEDVSGKRPRRRRSSRRTSDLSDLPPGSDNSSFQYEAAKLCKHCHRSPYEIHGRTDVLPALQLDPYSSFSAAYRLTHLSGAPPSPLSPNSPGAPTHLPLHLLPTLSPTERRARRLALALDADDPKLKDWAMEEYVKLGKAGRRLVREGVFEVQTGYQEPSEREAREEQEREYEWAAEQFSAGKVDDVFRAAATILNEMLQLQDEGGFGWREGEWGLDTPTRPQQFLLRPVEDQEDEDAQTSDAPTSNDNEFSRTPTFAKEKGKARAESPASSVCPTIQPSMTHTVPSTAPPSAPRPSPPSAPPSSPPSAPLTAPPTAPPTVPPSRPSSVAPSPAPVHVPFRRTFSEDTDAPSEALFKYSVEEAYPPQPQMLPESEPELPSITESRRETESLPASEPESVRQYRHQPREHVERSARASRQSYHTRETDPSRYRRKLPASPPPPSEGEDVAVSSDIEGSDGGLTTPGASRIGSPVQNAHSRSRRHISSGLTTPTRSPSPPSTSAPLFVPSRRPLRLKGGAASDYDPTESLTGPNPDPPSPPRSPSPSLSADLTPGPPPPSPSPHVMQIPNSVPFIPASLALPSVSDGEGSDDEPPAPRTAPLPPIQFWLPGFPTYPSPHAQPNAPTPPALFLALGARRSCIPYTPAFQGLDLRLVRPISARERLAIKDAVSVLESLGARAFGAGEREGGNAGDERRAKGEMWSLSYVGF